METLSDVLSEQIYGLTSQSLDREPILSTTGTVATIGLLVARMEELEETVARLTSLVQGLTDSQQEPVGAARHFGG